MWDWPCWPEPRPKAQWPPTRDAREARSLGEQSSTGRAGSALGLEDLRGEPIDPGKHSDGHNASPTPDARARRGSTSMSRMTTRPFRTRLAGLSCRALLSCRARPRAAAARPRGSRRRRAGETRQDGSWCDLQRSSLGKTKAVRHHRRGVSVLPSCSIRRLGIAATLVRAVGSL